MQLKAQDASVIYNKSVGSTLTIETDIGLGSGFFISDHTIVTNFHVIDGALEAYCYSPNSTTKYLIDGCIAIDKENDLALLKISSLNNPPLTISKTQIVTGQKIYVLGSPKGLPATISDGIISGLRQFENNRLMQITAPISAGSSGGPVIDANGELIGVSVGQLSEAQNINFAIPVIYLEKLLLHKDDIPIELATLFDKKGSFTDIRDSKNYKTIKIGSQIWMAENLNYNIEPGAWCYDKNNSNCIYYGRLYDFETAKKNCPLGWHLPSEQEWIILINYLGGSDIAGSKLKSLAHWSPDTRTNTTNESGFSGLPGGFYTIIDTYVGLSYQGLFWTSTNAEDINNSSAVRLYYLNDAIGWFEHNKNAGLSVRCIKN